MLINFFFTLRAAKLKVSVKEYLVLLEAIKEGVIDNSVDQFYYLARTSLVKDEAQFDKFDRAFAAYFKGVEMLTDFSQDIPLEWLQKKLELELSPEEKAAIEKMGWDELMETLKKRFEEQKERHEGGNKMIGTGGTSPFGAYGYNPQGIRIGQDKGRNKSAVKVWDQRQFKDYDDTLELGTRNIKVALRRLRRFAREGSEEELDLDDTIRATAANAGWLDIKMVPERHNKVKVLLLMDVGGTMDEHIHRVEEIFSAAKSEFKHLEFYYFHNCVYDFMWKNNRRRYSEKFPHLGRDPQVQQGLQADLRRRRDDEPVRDPAARRQRRIQQRGAGRRVAAAADPGVPEVRLDQPRAARRVGLPAEHRDRPAADEPAHVPAHLARARRGHATARANDPHPLDAVRAFLRGACGLLFVALGGCAMLPFGAGDAGENDAAKRAEAPADAASAPLEPARYRVEVDAPVICASCCSSSSTSRASRTRPPPTRITAAELDRLAAAAPAQARALLETEGYFNAEVTIERRERPGRAARAAASRVRPGPRTTVQPGRTGPAA